MKKFFVCDEEMFNITFPKDCYVRYNKDGRNYLISKYDNNIIYGYQVVGYDEYIYMKDEYNPIIQKKMNKYFAETIEDMFIYFKINNREHEEELIYG